MDREVIKKEPIIIIPAYCPDKRLLDLIWEIRVLSDLNIIVVDDGSGESYKNIFLKVREFSRCIVYTNEENQGKGIALKNGVRFASEKYPHNIGYVTADADGQHAADDIVSIADTLIKYRGNYLVVGKRNFSAKDVPLRSRVGNGISSAFFHLVTGTKCLDTQTGLRGIKREHENLFLNTEGSRYEFEMNFLMKAVKENIALKEVDIKTIYLDENKSSHFNPVKDSLRVFSGIFKFIGSSLMSSVIDLIMFMILSSTIFKTLSYAALASTIVARICSGIVNFNINQRWVFNGSKNRGEIIKYFILFISQMLASGLLVEIFSKGGFNATLIKMIVDGGLFFASYFIQKNIIFSEKQERI